MIPFVKTEALGNDFILVRLGDTGSRAYSSLAQRICDRRLGVGADGLILWAEPQKSGEAFRVRIFNIDGSEAECSGNGLRCMAAYLFTRRGVGGQVCLETISGVYALERAGDRYTADMGVPELRPGAIPVRIPGNPERVVDFPLEVDGRILNVTCCATGNPHCSLFVDDIEDGRVERLGPAIERHEAFPNRTNVEFVRVIDRSGIEVAFWERGAGRTPASGTGSCGAVVASVLNDRTGRRVTVHTTNGDLLVEWLENERLRLTADATVVAEGEYLLS